MDPPQDRCYRCGLLGENPDRSYEFECLHCWRYHCAPHTVLFLNQGRFGPRGLCVACYDYFLSGQDSEQIVTQLFRVLALISALYQVEDLHQ